LRDALNAKKQRKNAGKPLDLQREEEYHGSATFWSPSKFEQTREREAEKQHQEEQERLAKLNRKKLQANTKLLKEKEKEERRVARERTKEVRDRVKAERVAAREAKKATQNTRQAPIMAYRSERKASEVLLAKRKPKRAKGGAAARPSSLEAAPAPPPKVSSRGRTITLSRKLR
jgi:hypothetical protein